MGSSSVPCPSPVSASAEGELIQEGCELFLGIHDARSDPRDPVRSTGSRSVAASVTGPPSIDGSIRGSVVDVVDTAADPKGRTY